MYYALYEVESERFVRFGRRLSTDEVHSYWLDDLGACVFSVNEIELVVRWARTGNYKAGAMCYDFIKFLEDSIDHIDPCDLVCVPCDEHFNNVNYENSFPMLEL